jgi:hypothetical protein
LDFARLKSGRNHHDDAADMVYSVERPTLETVFIKGM